MRRSLLVLPVLAVAAVAVGGGLWLARPPTPPPNVLVILWDTTRADRLSLYGYPVPTTPRLDAFAKSATVYEHATPVGVWTLPTHTAMFTGLRETSHGLRTYARWLDGAHETLAEQLLASGYDTFAFSANPMVSPITNLTQGFETVHTSFARPGARGDRYTRPSRRATRQKLIPGDASGELSPGWVGREGGSNWGPRVMFKDAGPVAHQALVDFLDERPGRQKPFFAYLNLMEAHSPRIPSMGSRRRVSDEATIRAGLATDQSLYALHEGTVGARSFTPEALQAIGAVYDASVRDLDDVTGDLLDDLAARGILDDTVVIVVADHGEALGEHGYWEHRWNVYEPLLHVPLVIRYPKRFEAGARVSERVSTADLYATVLELAGLTPPGKAWSTSLVGRKVFDPFVFAQALDPMSSQLGALLEVHPELDTVRYTRPRCAAYQGSSKLLYDPVRGEHELYDLAADPGEARNLYDPAGAPARALEAALAAFEEGLPVFDPATRSAEARAHLEEAGGDGEAAQLAMLGYTDGPEAAHADFCGPRGAPPR